MSDASVRTARSSDIDPVGRVQAAVWRDAYDGIVDRSALDQFEAANFAAAWRASLAAPPSPIHRLLVATELEDVVGFVAIGPAADGEGEILAGGVDPDHRHRGHGSRLLNAAIDTLAVNDINAVRTLVLERDTLLVRFLAEAGFGLTGEFADRVVSADGSTVREIELLTGLGEEPAPHEHEH
ncbi:GNAT family N-acetyltransferase [Calidifontibacter terrae]